VEGRTYVEVYEDRLLCKHFLSTQQYSVKPLLLSVSQKSEQQMASIKQWFTARQRFSSDIIQLNNVGPTVFLLEFVPVPS
jgi:hypothetical protein